MTTTFKIAALNTLAKSSDYVDIMAMSSVRTRVKAKDLKVGDIVKNILDRRFYAVQSIDKSSLCYLVTLDCCSSVDGSKFTMDLFGDYIDVYAV